MRKPKRSKDWVVLSVLSSALFVACVIFGADRIVTLGCFLCSFISMGVRDILEELEEEK